MPKSIHTIDDFSTGKLTFPLPLGKISGDGLVCGKNNVKRGGLWWRDDTIFHPIASLGHVIWVNKIYSKGGLSEWASPIDIIPTSDTYGQEIDKNYLVFSADFTLWFYEKGTINYDSKYPPLLWPGVTTDGDLLHNTHFTSLDNVLYFSSNTETADGIYPVPSYFQYFREREKWLGFANDDAIWTTSSYSGEKTGPASVALPTGTYSLLSESDPYRGFNIPLVKKWFDSEGVEQTSYIANVEFDRTDTDLDHQGRYGYSFTYKSGDSDIVFDDFLNDDDPPLPGRNFRQILRNIRIFPHGQEDYYGVFPDNSEINPYMFDRVIGLKVWFEDVRGDEATSRITLVVSIDFDMGASMLGSNHIWIQSGSTAVIGPSLDLEFLYDDLVQTYMTTTGIMYPEWSNDVVKYRLSVISGNQRYAVDYNGDLFVSPQSQIDVLVSNIHEVKGIPTGGGDVQYIHVEASTVFLFRERRIDVLGILHDSEFGVTTLTSSQTYNGMGIHARTAICNSPLGVIWVNKNGIFSLESGAPKQILNDKITSEYWHKEFIGEVILESQIFYIGYSAKENEIVVYADRTQSENASDWNFLIYNIENETVYTEHGDIEGEDSDRAKTQLISFSDGDLVFFNSVVDNEGDEQYYPRVWSNKNNDLTLDTEPNASLSLSNIFLGNLNKEKIFYGIKLTTTGGSLTTEDTNVVIYIEIYNRVGYKLSAGFYGFSPGVVGGDNYDISLDSFYWLVGGDKKGYSIALNLEMRSDPNMIIDDISIIYREIGSKTKKTHSVANFSTNIHGGSETSETGVICTGFIPQKDSIIVGGKWMPYYFDNPHGIMGVDYSFIAATLGEDVTRNGGIGLVHISTNLTDGTPLNDDALIVYRENENKLYLSLIRTNETLGLADNIITTAAFSPELTGGKGTYSFSQNGDDIYFARKFRGSTSEPYIGVWKHIKRPDKWLGDDNSGLDGFANGEYFGSPRLDIGDYELRWDNTNTRVIFDNAPFGEEVVQWLYIHMADEELNDDDESIFSGNYGMSLTYDGGETLINYTDVATGFYQTITLTNIVDNLSAYFYSRSDKNKLIIGATLWFKNNSTGETVRVAFLDFALGVSYGISGTYNKWVASDHNDPVGSGEKAFIFEDLTAITYESLYGKEKAYFDANLVDYKYSVISGKRRYAIGIDNNLYISPEGEIDNLVDSIHDIAGIPNLGGESIALFVKEGKVFLFRESALIVIEVEAAEEMGVMQVSNSSIYAGMGINGHYSLCSVKGEVAWVNGTGLFMLEGDAPKNLITGRIEQSRWKEFTEFYSQGLVTEDLVYPENATDDIPGYHAHIGFSVKTNEIVVWGCEKPYDGDAVLNVDGKLTMEKIYSYSFYVYNMENETFYHLDKSFMDTDIEDSSKGPWMRGMYSLSDGTLLGLFKDSVNDEWTYDRIPTQNRLYKWNLLAAADNTFSEADKMGRIIVPPQNCGSPSIKKKFYEAIISYQGLFDGTVTIVSNVYGLGPAVASYNVDPPTYTASLDTKTDNFTPVEFPYPDLVVDVSGLSKGFALGFDIIVNPQESFAITGIEITYREMEI